MDLDHDIEDELEPRDPSVPTDLLDLYVHLDEAGVSPEEFKEMHAK